MKKPHKHVELIKAWADGAEIEFLDTYSKEPFWRDAVMPHWDECTKYRIKPTDVVVEWLVQKNQVTYFDHNCPKEEKNLRLTFDGETGKLKSAEIL